MEYTKGEWYNHNGIIETAQAPNGHVIAVMNKVGDRVQADGNLIAMAPDMHKEIKATIEKLGIYLGEWASVTETYSPEWTHAIRHIIEDLEKALAELK